MAKLRGDERGVSLTPLMVAQLETGTDPSEIEDALIAQGASLRAAREAIQDSFTHLREVRQALAGHDLLVGWLSLPVFGLLFLCFAGPGFFAEDLRSGVRGKLWGGAVVCGIGIVDAFRRLLRARVASLEYRWLGRAWDRWEKRRTRGRAAPPVDDEVPFADLAAVPPPLPPGSTRSKPAGAAGSWRSPPPARDVKPSRSRPAKVHEDKSVSRWVIGSVVGAVLAFGFFLLLGVLIFAPSSNSGAFGPRTWIAPSLGPAIPAVRPPVAIEPAPPPPVEGPPPKGWTVLFRADDPALWDTTSPGEKFAVPVSQAHSTIRYLRLKRMDTWQVLILPVTQKQLTHRPTPPPLAGVEWNGTNSLESGGRHLGILHGPRSNRAGSISVLNDGKNAFTGSGFGHKVGGPEKQCFCWRGEEIEKTAFEIAVTSDPLTAREKAHLTGATPIEPSPPRGEGWTVLFRSDDPAIWNTESLGAKFAIPVSRADGKIRYLRLERMDTKDVLFIPITRDLLAGRPRLPVVKGTEWNGTNHLEYGGRHLGIISGPRFDWPNLPKGTISVMNDGWNAFGGSGFGHEVFAPEKQCYSWKGEECPRTAFEIAVTSGPLTPAEEKCLAK